MQEAARVKHISANSDVLAQLGKDAVPADSSTTSRVLGPAALLSGMAALLTASCCALPIALSLAGLSGAWLGQLSSLAPYREWLQAGALLVLGAAWVIHFAARRHARQAASCGRDGTGACGTSRRRGTFLLVGASILTVSAMLLDWYEGDVIGFLLEQS
jgi:hypothetical protein